MMDKEYQTLGLGPIEVRAEEDGGVRVSGYAAVFGQKTDIGGMFTEQIERRAFDQSLADKDDVMFLVEHDGLPLARTRSGTLTLTADDHGLRMETRLDPTDPDAQAVIRKLRRKDLDKMSIGFYSIQDTWRRESDPPHRVVERAKLFDVSVVSRPAYKGTDIALRNAAGAAMPRSPAGFETRLREADALAARLRSVC